MLIDSAGWWFEVGGPHNCCVLTLDAEIFNECLGEVSSDFQVNNSQFRC